jgi:predicted ester cyclase
MNSLRPQFSNKEIAEEYAYKIWNEKDLNAIDQLLDNEIIIHSVLGDFHGLEAMKEVVKKWLNGFPDLYVTNEIVISENDIVSIQWRAKGTHLGEFKGRQPSGKAVTYVGSTVYRIINSKIVEYWSYIDMQHLLSQI